MHSNYDPQLDQLYRSNSQYYMPKNTIYDTFSRCTQKLGFHEISNNWMKEERKKMKNVEKKISKTQEPRVKN